MNYEAIFMQWMEDHEKLIRHLIIGFEAKPALQDELLQDIALNLWRALPSFRKDASVKTFVARIAHNALASHVAKAVKTVKADQDVDNLNKNVGDVVEGLKLIKYSCYFFIIPVNWYVWQMTIINNKSLLKDSEHEIPSWMRQVRIIQYKSRINCIYLFIVLCFCLFSFFYLL